MYIAKPFPLSLIINGIATESSSPSEVPAGQITQIFLYFHIFSKVQLNSTI